MHATIAIREASRVYLAILLARLTLAVFWVVAALLANLPLFWGLRVLAIGPLLFATALVAFPWSRRVLGRCHLAVALTVDLLGVSLQAIPVFFLRRATMVGRFDLAAPEIRQWVEGLLVEPFLLLLVPIVLLGWAYGRRGALWGSTWASLLHIGAGIWFLRADLLDQAFLLGQAVRVSLIYAVPLLVALLAERERRYIGELEAAHASLQRHTATVEQLAVSRERNRMARDLHDTLSHSLAALTVHLGALRTLQAHDPPAAEAAAEDAVALARLGLEESRGAIQALRADPLKTLGLVGAIRVALQTLEARAGIAPELVVAGEEPDLTNEEALALYRIAEEALVNAERHSGAQQVSVRLSFGQDRVDLTVRDDGLGFDSDSARITQERYGLTGMRERAAIIGADLVVRSRPGHGTEVQCTLERDGAWS